jgi:hypothetical protein
MTAADSGSHLTISEWEDQESTTALFLPLMDLLERFAQHCFRRDVAFAVDSGTLLGVVRHRAVIPWDYDVDLGILRAEFVRLCNGFGDQTELRLDFDAYGEPDAAICVVPPGPSADDAPFLDLVIYEPDGRSTMTETLQRRSDRMP